jgi:hypothetical protein
MAHTHRNYIEPIGLAVDCDKSVCLIGMLSAAGYGLSAQQRPNRCLGRAPKQFLRQFSNCLKVNYHVLIRQRAAPWKVVTSSQSEDSSLTYVLQSAAEPAGNFELRLPPWSGIYGLWYRLYLCTSAVFILHVFCKGVCFETKWW